MWVIAEYEATALFSLKPATATASGGRTLLVPTPFAIKMALLDVVCRLEGAAAGEAAWAWLNMVRVALQPPEQIVVNNTIIKVQRQWEFKGKKEDREDAVKNAQRARKYPFLPTITYREYAYLHGAFSIALETGERWQAEHLSGWLMQINYLGKRGSFIQVLDVPRIVDALPSKMAFVQLSGSLESFQMGSTLTQLDDTAEAVSFEQVNIYTSKPLRLGRERVLHQVALPYRVAQSSRGYTYYQRVQDEE